MFYDKFEQLCNEKKVKPTRAALDMGLSKSTPTIWKTKNATPSGATLNKVAEYFNVSIDYLTGKTNIRSPIISELANAFNKSPETVKEVAGDSIAKLEKDNNVFSEMINDKVDEIRKLYYKAGFQDGEKSAQKEPATTKGDGLDSEILERINRLDESRKEDAIKYLDFLISQGEQ